MEQQTVELNSGHGVRYSLVLVVVIVVGLAIGVTIFMTVNKYNSQDGSVSIDSSPVDLNDDNNGRLVIPELIDYVPQNPAKGDGSDENPIVVADITDPVYQKLAPKMVQILDWRDVWGWIEIKLVLPDEVINQEYQWTLYLNHESFDPVGVFDAGMVNSDFDTMSKDGENISGLSEQTMVLEFTEEDYELDSYLVFIVRAKNSDGRYIYFIYGADGQINPYRVPRLSVNKNVTKDSQEETQ